MKKREIVIGLAASFGLATSFVFCTAPAYAAPLQGQVQTIQSNGIPAYQYPIGGIGTDGAKTLSGTETQIMQYNATTITLGGAYTNISGSIYNCTGAFTTGANTWTVGKGYAGGDANQSTSPQGGGPAGGTQGSVRGGGGGGCAGAGGQASATSNTPAGEGGAAVPLIRGLMGSGGGTGYWVNGGAGGGNLEICNSSGGITISTSGAINAVGTASPTNASANALGSGGGSGGIEGFYSTVSVTHTGTCSVAGGNSGAMTNASGTWGGGGGGGGYGIDHSPSNTGAGTKTVSGGTATGTGSGNNGSAGASGVWLTITGTPNNPLLTEHRRQIREMIASGWMEDGHHGRGHEAPMFAIARAQAICFGDGEHWTTTQEEHVTQIAAWKSTNIKDFKSELCKLNNSADLDGSGKVCQLGVSDAVENNAT